MSTPGFWSILQPHKDLALLIATTQRGVVQIATLQNKNNQVEMLQSVLSEYDWNESRKAPHQQNTAKQIIEYFKRKRHNFDLPLVLRGSEFQKHVWQSLMKIPYGELLSYGDLAAFIDKPRAARAVGGAVGKCEHLIVIPCHRVISGSGGIGGFGSCLGVKRILLEVEGHKFE